jgi:signal transduction histidine kinase
VLGWIAIAVYTFLITFTNFEFSVQQSIYSSSITAWILALTLHAYLVAISLVLIYRFYDYLTLSLENQYQLNDAKEENIEQKNALIHTIINNLPYAIRWKDSNLVYQGANRKFLKDLKIESMNDLSDSCDPIAHREEDAITSIEQEAAIINGITDKFSYEMEIINADKSRVYKVVQRVALKDKDNNIIGLLISDNDITDIKTLELNAQIAKKEAEQANVAKSRFLANMSHEIRTPLTGVLGLLELTLKTNLEQKQLGYLQKAQLSTLLLKQIINDVLDISKIEAGQLALEVIPFNINEQLKILLEMHIDEAHAKGIDLIFNFEGDENISLLGDPTRLLQVLINVCANAIKFTNKGSVNVAVIQQQKDDNVVVDVVVKDTGIGIEKSALPALFDIFTQADTGISRHFGGSGLGLNIVKNLVEKMSGTIKVDSVIGVGTEFSMSFPFAICEVEPELDVPSTQNTNKSHSKILLIEDNEINQEIASSMIMEGGHQVCIANHGKEGLAYLDQEDFDFVFLDIQMPVMDGLATIKEIRKQERFKTLPVIALTANVMATEIQDYMSNGFTAHIGKPFVAKALLDCIAKYS